MKPSPRLELFASTKNTPPLDLDLDQHQLGPRRGRLIFLKRSALVAKQRDPEPIHLKPGQSLDVHFEGREKMALSHLVDGEEDRVVVGMPVINEGPTVPFLVLSQSKNDDGSFLHQAIFLEGDDEKAFIGTGRRGEGALFLRIDGEYQRLDFDMLEQHVRDNPFFGETVYSPS